MNTTKKLKKLKKLRKKADILKGKLAYEKRRKELRLEIQALKKNRSYIKTFSLSENLKDIKRGFEELSNQPSLSRTLQLNYKGGKTMDTNTNAQEVIDSIEPAQPKEIEKPQEQQSGLLEMDMAAFDLPQSDINILMPF